jgi:cytochrome b561
MTTRILHWVMAILILSTIALGFVIANDWGGPLQSLSTICTARSEC